MEDAMINIGTLEQISEIMNLGIVDVYNIPAPKFVNFGNNQAIPYGKARSYYMDTTVAIYMVVGDSLDAEREREFIGIPQSRQLFPRN